MLTLASAASAVVSIETVPVGNLGNAADSTGYGAVADAYRIGTYEVTAGQYREFLSAVAESDTYALYNTKMSTETAGCKIQRSGDPGSYTYTVAANWADRPVNFVSWGDAARFANWMHNGQPTGAQDQTTTEDGSYYLNGATTNTQLLAVTRESDWTWAVPTENEWYKAAYHKNDGVTGNYWDYPTQRDDTDPPSNDLVEPTDPGNNATFEDSGFTIGYEYYRTEIGAHENSEGPYDTFDMGGNVWEWNEAMFGTVRGLRGGSWAHHLDKLLASYRYDFGWPTSEYTDLGFRMVEVPEPASAMVMAIGGMIVACRRKRR